MEDVEDKSDTPGDVDISDTPGDVELY